MYQRLVRRRVRGTFDSISRRDLEPVLAGLSPDVHHRFAGDHPLGGERHSREAVAVAAACAFMHAHGVPEAAAPPIES